MTKLIDIEGIGEAYAGKLEAAGIASIEALLQSGGDKKGRVALAEKTGISETLVLKWVNRADLARVKGIGTQYADLLEQAGVDSVPELAQRKAENLHAKMAEINTAKNLVRQMPSAAAVAEWVAHAKTLPRAVSH